MRGLARGGWDLLVISLFSVEKARDEAKELPGVVTLSVLMIPDPPPPLTSELL